MNYPMISRTLRHKITDMKLWNQKVTLYQFGLFIILGLLTMATMRLIVSGDSMTPKNNDTTPQSIQKK